MGSSDEEYAAFEEKVKRTVYVDNLSPLVTLPVLRSAFDQFGKVKSVHLITNYYDPKDMAQAALVEMENTKQAEETILGMSSSPFMVSGMPRPIRTRAAEASMFDDRLRKPGREIAVRWVERNDPDFEVANKMKFLTGRHAAESSFLLKKQLEEEKKLATQQSETLSAHYKKYEMIENVIGDGSVNQLARYYGMRPI